MFHDSFPHLHSSAHLIYCTLDLFKLYTNIPNYSDILLNSLLHSPFSSTTLCDYLKSSNIIHTSTYLLYVPWRHTLNLRCTCAYHVYIIRNHCSLMSSLTLTPSRLFLILLNPKSFQTILASVTWLLGHMLSIHCRLIITAVLYLS